MLVLCVRHEARIRFAKDDATTSYVKDSGRSLYDHQSRYTSIFNLFSLCSIYKLLPRWNNPQFANRQERERERRVLAFTVSTPWSTLHDVVMNTTTRYPLHQLPRMSTYTSHRGRSTFTCWLYHFYRISNGIHALCIPVYSTGWNRCKWRRLWRVLWHHWCCTRLSRGYSARCWWRTSYIISLMQKFPAFMDLDGTWWHKIVDAFTIMDFAAGEPIVSNNELFMVKSGHVRIKDIGLGASKFQDQLLAKESTLANVPWSPAKLILPMSVVTQLDSVNVQRKVLEKVLGPLEEVISRSSHGRALASIRLFEWIENDEIDEFMKRLKEESFERGDKIASWGKLYLIRKGSVLMPLGGEDAVMRRKQSSELQKLWLLRIYLEQRQRGGEQTVSTIATISCTRKYC